MDICDPWHSVWSTSADPVDTLQLTRRYDNLADLFV